MSQTPMKKIQKLAHEMKTIKAIKFLLLALPLLLLASCSDNKYTDVIPKNSSFVASVNFKSIAEKGELSSSNKLKMFKEYLGLIIGNEDKGNVEDIITSPEKIGIDFSKPAYIFKTPDNCIGIAMKMGDDDDFSSFLELLNRQGLCTKPTAQDGSSNGNLLDDIYYTFDGNKILLVAPLDDSNSAIAKRCATLLMDLNKEDRFTQTETFSKFEKSEADINTYANLAALPADLAKRIIGLLPRGVEAKDMEMFGAATFENGRATLSADLFSEKEKAKKLIEESGKHLRKINGSYIDSPSEDFLLWACAGIDGEWLLNLLKQDKELKQVLFAINRGIDADMIIKSIKGDAAVVLPQEFYQDDSDDTPFIAMANLNDTKFLKDVTYWKESMREYGMTMSETAKNHFVLKTDDFNICWGVDDKNLFFATEEAYKKNAFSPRSTVLKRHEQQIKASTIFFYINLKSLPLRELGQVINISGDFSDALSRLESIIFRTEGLTHYELSVETSDKDTNILKQLFE